MRFGEAGEFSSKKEVVMGRCSTNDTGYFAVVVRYSSTIELPPAPAGEERRWRNWSVVCGGLCIF